MPLEVVEYISGNRTLIHVPRNLKNAGGLQFTFRVQKMFPDMPICIERLPKALHHPISKKDDKICQPSYTPRPPKALEITINNTFKNSKTYTVARHVLI
jgi:hypothetical protein